ncbi:TfpX/TfpZ family type IV pilin accessory protein [Acidovorax sp. MR-S7]|uniref:TfpX/TfpZ family type IV pilin accessory protein n=1 Tax=Acidovorax sp. MR-S7 TaxID=1268622 RepID=UPI0003D3CEF7|nr:TfpX/TfpZ family type IV pilin accessory protein [Acidovorax sp. MR-S7]GAD22883.1 hypothetical protein AVS7_02643 [Acidovorax sp. MR-S7]
MHREKDKRSVIRAVSWHFSLSLVIAVITAGVTFGLWFPYPYRELAGGGHLFWLIVGVDVVCGPLLTAVVFNSRKPLRELMLDLGCIGLIQLGALTYGLYSLWHTRPIYLAFEVDRFQVVTYADIKKDDLKPESERLHRLPWAGVRLIGTRTPANGAEMMESLDLSLRGFSPAFRPDWWQDYEYSIDRVKARAHAVADLKKKRPDAEKMINDKIAQAGIPEVDMVWLPVTSFRSLEWVVVLSRKTGQTIVFLPVDGF